MPASPPRRTTRHTVVVGLLAWAVTLAGLRLSAALPEPCPTVTTARLSAAAGRTVDWFARNQHPAGDWVYLYRPDAPDPVPEAYNLVRHAGVTMSLYQAAAAGFVQARPVADAGTAWALEHVVAHDGWSAVAEPRERVRVGATALLVAGLVERRELTGDTGHDRLLGRMGRFLASQVRPDGSVLAAWDPTTGAPVPDEVSIYFTGEVGWALARLAVTFPDAGWDRWARRIAGYLPHRDAAEGNFPPTPDHWAAYQLDTLAHAGGLDADVAAWAERLAGVLGAQSRFQAKALRPPGQRYAGEVRAAALGTTGEGLGALWRLDGTLAGHRDTLGDRVRCVGGQLVDTQVGAAEAVDHPHPGLARGAWIANGETRMDDQQHGLSALLAALDVTRAREHDG